MLKFNYDNRFYELRFRLYNIVQIIGDSATGKTLMSSDLRKAVLAAEAEAEDAKELGFAADDAGELTPDNIEVIVFTNKAPAVDDFRKAAKECKYIIVDNAERAISEAARKVIVQSVADSANYWIILGRKPLKGIDVRCMAELVNRQEGKKRTFSLRYIGDEHEFTVDNNGR